MKKQKRKENPEAKVIPLNAADRQNGQPSEKDKSPENAQTLKMLQLSIEDANSFISIVNIILPKDLRANSITTHFTDMLNRNNSKPG